VSDIHDKINKFINQAKPHDQSDWLEPFLGSVHNQNDIKLLVNPKEILETHLFPNVDIVAYERLPVSALDIQEDDDAN